MINNVTLVGRLTKDPELRYTQTGVAVARFTLAVNRAFSNQQGEKEADFINCVAWRKQAENLVNYMTKGSQVGVTGSIQTGNYDDKDGKRVYTTEVLCNSIQFLEPSNRQQANAPQQQQRQHQQQPSQTYRQQPQQQVQQQTQRQQQPQQPQQQGYGQPNNYTQQYQQPGNYVDMTDDDLPF